MTDLIHQGPGWILTFFTVLFVIPLKNTRVSRFGMWRAGEEKGVTLYLKTPPFLELFHSLSVRDRFRCLVCRPVSVERRQGQKKSSS